MADPDLRFSHPMWGLLSAAERGVGRVLLALWRVGVGFACSLVRLAASVAGIVPQTRFAHRMIGIGGLAAIVAPIFWLTRDPIVNWVAATAGMRPLLEVRTWHYHLDKQDAAIIQQSDADMLVIDFAIDGGRNPFSKAAVERMKTRRDGTQRLAIAYLSVGEAETYRFYWDKSWEGSDASRPSWLVAPNCAWPGAWSIKFWEDGWKAIVYRGAQSYLNRIVDAGFDGVYLDRVDIFEQFAKGEHGAPANVTDAMIDFVIELAATARKRKPGFLVIPQNGEPLLSSKRYRRAIDGLGKEDLLYGHSGTGERNPKDDIKWSYGYLKRLLADHKPIFAVEYLVTKEAIADARLELRELGLVPTFQDRSLDGSDPTMPRFDAKPTEGTPEWIRTMCDKSNSW